MSKWKVYISSTFIDLREFRAELIRLFENQLQPNFELSRIMERMFDDGSYTPFVEDCVEAVQSCDIYIIILGNRTGSFPPGEDRTYTEVELDTAIAHKKRIFCLRLETFDEAKIDDKAKHNDLLNKFEGRFTHSFDNTPELEKSLYDCLFPFALQSPVNTKNPYKGLAAFGVEDGDYFFGRDAEIEACLKKIVTAKGHRFVSVIGSSGTGKSSFVQAGLLHCLKHDEKLGFSRHPQIIVSPGSEAFTNLQYQLQLQGLSVEAILLGNTEFILFFDQFEEVITQCYTPEAGAERKQLFNFLDKLTASQNKLAKFLVICAFRSDFSSQLANYDYIKSRQHIFLLSSLDYKIHANNWEQSIREIITRPAVKNGIAIEKELTDQLLNQLKEVEGALPILQFSLEQLWSHETIKDRCISAADYSRLSGGKGMAGIIEAHAEDVVKSITNNGKDKAREAVLKSLFVNLVEVNENLKDVKRTVPKDELFRILKVYPEHIVHEVFEVLVSEKSRLLQVSQEKDEAVTVSVIHETLIRKWERLKNWIDERREALERKKRLLHDIAAYQKGEEGLYRGRKLKNAWRWKASNPDLSNDSINIFLIRSQKNTIQRMYKRTVVILLLFVLIFAVWKTFVPFINKKNFLAEIVNYDTLNREIMASGSHIDSVTGLTMNESNHIFLSKNIHFFKNLKSLRIEGLKEKKDLTCLQYMEHKARISFLKVENNDNLLSLEGIENLLPVDSLAIENNDKLESLESIEELINLKSLIVESNFSLISIEGIENLANLKNLKIIYNRELIGLKSIENLPELNSLVIEGNKKLLNLEGVEKLKNLNSLTIKSNDSLTSLTGIENLLNLRHLMIKNNQKLSGLEDLKKMPNLTHLMVNNCQSLISLEGIESLKGLSSLTIYGTNLTSLKGIENLTNLKSLLITRNPIVNLRGIENLKALSSLTISGTNLESLKDIRNLIALDSLLIGNNKKLESLKGIENLKNLNSLAIMSNDHLTNIKDIKNLKALNALKIEFNSSLPDLEGIENLTSLNSLAVRHNDSLISIAGIEKLTNLTSLIIERNGKLNYMKSFRDIGRIRNLINLNTLKTKFNNLPNLENIANLLNLYSLTIEGNNNLTSLGEIENLSNLTALTISYNDSLTSLAGIEKLKALSSLIIMNDNRLYDLKGVQKITKLDSLSIINCKRLTNIADIKKLKNLRFLSIGGNHPGLNPEVLYTLTNLEELRLSYKNDLDVDIKRIQKNNPGIKIYNTLNRIMPITF